MLILKQIVKILAMRANPLVGKGLGREASEDANISKRAMSIHLGVAKQGHKVS